MSDKPQTFQSNLKEILAVIRAELGTPGLRKFANEWAYKEAQYSQLNQTNWMIKQSLAGLYPDNEKYDREFEIQLVDNAENRKITRHGLEIDGEQTSFWYKNDVGGMKQPYQTYEVLIAGLKDDYLPSTLNLITIFETALDFAYHLPEGLNKNRLIRAAFGLAPSTVDQFDQRYDFKGIESFNRETWQAYAETQPADNHPLYDSRDYDFWAVERKAPAPDKNLKSELQENIKKFASHDGSKKADQPWKKPDIMNVFLERARDWEDKLWPNGPVSDFGLRSYDAVIKSLHKNKIQYGNPTWNHNIWASYYFGQLEFNSLEFLAFLDLNIERIKGEYSKLEKAAAPYILEPLRANEAPDQDNVPKIVCYFKTAGEGLPDLISLMHKTIDSYRQYRQGAIPKVIDQAIDAVATEYFLWVDKTLNEFNSIKEEIDIAIKASLEDKKPQQQKKLSPELDKHYTELAVQFSKVPGRKTFSYKQEDKSAAKKKPVLTPIKKVSYSRVKDVETLDAKVAAAIANMESVPQDANERTIYVLMREKLTPALHQLFDTREMLGNLLLSAGVDKKTFIKAHQTSSSNVYYAMHISANSNSLNIPAETTVRSIQRIVEAAYGDKEGKEEFIARYKELYALKIAAREKVVELLTTKISDDVPAICNSFVSSLPDEFTVATKGKQADAREFPQFISRPPLVAGFSTKLPEHIAKPLVALIEAQREKAASKGNDTALAAAR